VSKALIVDDVPANLLSIAALLEGLGCRIETARSGDEALQFLLRETFAVMLLDVHMPGMDGFEVARHVRMHSRTRDLPIIFLTAAACDPDESQRLAYDCGAVDFLFKPINRYALRSKVKVFVELYTRRCELADANERLEQANAKLLALADAEATSSSALRQAHDDLGTRYRELRGTHGQPIETTTLRSLDGFPVLETGITADPMIAAVNRIQLARASLARLRERDLSNLTQEGEAECHRLAALLSEATLQLGRVRDSYENSGSRRPDIKQGRSS